MNTLSTAGNVMTSSDWSMTRPLLKRMKGSSRIEGDTILKRLWASNLLCFPGASDIQPY